MVNYDKWINGDCCCNQNERKCCCDGTDACSCDSILLEISKLHTDDEILQDEIDELSGKVEVISATVDTKLDASAYTPVDLTDYATKQWVEDKHYLTTVEPLKTINGESLIGEGNIVISGGSGGTVDAYTKAESDARFQPIGNYLSATALNGYATEQWVENKNYLTEHQPLKTINNMAITGTGNIEITASGGTIDIDYNLSSASTNPVANSAITNALNSKLDITAYTPTEQVQSDWNVTDTDSKAYIKNKPTIPSLNGYATEQWVLDKHYISGVDLSDYALKSEIPTVPTSNSAFTNDEHFITSADTVFNNYALTANTYTKTEVDNKFWCGTQAEYDALSGTTNGVLYLIHD